METKAAMNDVSDSSSDSDSEAENIGCDFSNDDNVDNLLTLFDDYQTVLIVPDYGGGKPEDYAEEPGECEAEVTRPLSEPTHEVPSSTTLQHQVDGENQKRKRKRKKVISICLTACKYESVRRAARRYGFKDVGEEDDWNLYWTDFSVSLERVMDMKRYQKINHFPGMSELCRKDLLARNLNRMYKLFPKDYNIFPRSWCLPADHGDFLAYTRQKKNKTYILKPESGCQGRGIWLTKTPKDIKPHEHMLCQQYISKPFLIDGFKFDLRIYALVTSCDPLRIFVFKEGLGRFATAKYVTPTVNNVGNVYMHLTNYAINKNSSDFIRDEESGSKRRITTINKWLKDNEYDVEKLWKEIDDVIIKTLISAHAVLKHNYRTCFPNHVLGSGCFEILGFDIVLDKKLRPFVLEVNHSPSFTTDAAIDREIKDVLLYDTLDIVNFGAADKKKCIEEERRKIKERLMNRVDKKDVKEDLDRAQQKWIEAQANYEDKHMGNYRRIYPTEGMEKYEKFFHNSGSLYQETAAFKARSECARQQREEINRKVEKLEQMLNKKKKDPNLLRPESPGERSKARMRPKKPAVKISQRNESDVISDRNNCTMVKKYRVHYTVGNSKLGQVLDPMSSGGGSSNRTMEDSSKPQDIVDAEEMERVAGLVQRENLVRGLGIAEHISRLLENIPNSNVSTQKTSNKNLSHAVDSVSSCLNEVSLQMLTGQSRAYNGLNNTSSFSTAVAKLIPSHASQRNTYSNGMMLGHRNAVQWKSLQNLHRTGNALGEIYDRNVRDLPNMTRYGNRNVYDNDSSMIANEIARIIPPGKGLLGQNLDQQLPIVARRNAGVSTFGSSLISGPAPFAVQPAISSAGTSGSQRVGAAPGISNGDRMTGVRGRKLNVRTVRGNSTGVTIL